MSRTDRRHILLHRSSRQAKYHAILRRAAVALAFVAAILLCSCSSTKFVPEGRYLLDKVDIRIEDNRDDVKASQLVNYLRQQPNHKVLGFAKLQLATYNLSGRDTARWYNRWIRRMGQPPVIYDSGLTDASARQLRQAMINRGYLSTTVDVDTVFDPRKKKASVTYRVTSRQPHRIGSVGYEFDDTSLRRVVMADSSRFTVHPGALLDRNNLDAERQLISERLRHRGYYGFGKEHIAFLADTAAGSNDVDLTVVIKRPVTRVSGGLDTLDAHSRYILRKIYYVTDYNPTASPGTEARSDTLPISDNVYIVCGRDRYLTPQTLVSKSFLQPGELYNEQDVSRTYESLSRLGILRSINIDMRRAGRVALPGGESVEMLDAYVLLTRNKLQGITLEVEGTNSEGDLGFGIGVSYQHRNVSKASNTFTAKARLNYESLSGNFNGLINNRYTEYAAETGLTFPKFVFPFLSDSYKRRVKASSELALSFNYQERPEYTRIIAGAGWKYKWTSLNGRRRRTFDLVDINYVYLPESTIDFINEIAPDNPLLRYSYEDHFIMRMGYTINLTNRRTTSASMPGGAAPWQRTVYSFRASAETAGNILYAISSLDGQKRHDGVYRLFGIAYSQYVKGEVDYGVTHNYNTRHALAFHAGAGIGVPYGNSEVLPFEKRFYAGGANGVRGWGVRTLGPGSYDSRNSMVDFINQCGDIRLDLNVEYRVKLFWVLEGALFVDAGNIWTIRDYPSQPGGVFRFDSFWKQIALAYGAGLRLDFTYFLVRLDLGLKAHNPAQGQEPWPIIHPRWHRDATFHFSVGYPF
ncbi:MAG: BamA/TamA family outer membrane protein [Clostridium sp.]|nr:BamA/TamA family outer membrane protein [Clostridium sp.]